MYTENYRGLIPGPVESAEEFVKRLRLNAPLPPGDPIPADHWTDARLRLAALFDLEPDWIYGIYSNRKLPFWQGAATWIGNGPPFLQLRKGFKQGTYFGLYTRAEVLSHEMAHVCRCNFNEPQFEELFAYATSSSRWRRFFGPLFRYPWESTLFLFVTLLTVPAQLFLDEGGLRATLLTLPWIAFSYFLIRLIYAHRLLRRARNNLEQLDPRPMAVLFRLTDAEVRFFARSSPAEISAYVLKQNCPRWQMIKASYFPKS